MVTNFVSNFWITPHGNIAQQPAAVNSRYIVFDMDSPKYVLKLPTTTDS